MEREQILERFWDKVEKTDSCWLWKGSKTSGYGQFPTAKKYWLCDSYLVHRISYSLMFDDYDSSKVICHKCDNPLCVNPEHLFIGTQKENMADCLAKGRLNSQIGENHNKAKLKWNEVREIRIRYSEGGISLRELANEYGITKSVVQKIVKNKIWVE